MKRVFRSVIQNHTKSCPLQKKPRCLQKSLSDRARAFLLKKGFSEKEVAYCETAPKEVARLLDVASRGVPAAPTLASKVDYSGKAGPRCNGHDDPFTRPPSIAAFLRKDDKQCQQ